MGLLRCICDETRFAILETLGREGELSVGTISKTLGKDQPLVSHHLRILKECGILTCRIDGRRSLYKISSVRISALIADILEASNRINALCSETCCTQDGQPEVIRPGMVREARTRGVRPDRTAPAAVPAE